MRAFIFRRNLKTPLIFGNLFKVFLNLTEASLFVFTSPLCNLYIVFTRPLAHINIYELECKENRSKTFYNLANFNCQH